MVATTIKSSFFITPDGSTKTEKAQQYKMKNKHKYRRKN